jgi:aquaporin Z
MESSFGAPNSLSHGFDFDDPRYEARRVFAEVFGTFLLVLVAAGAGIVNARFGGHKISPAAQAVAPGLMVGTVILFMGTASGAHLNPAVTLAFAARRDFPWKRVPAYLVAQAVGALLATVLLVALLGRHGTAGLTVPGDGITPITAMWWEMLLTVGLVSTILGTASGAQSLGPLAAVGVGGYIALAGLWGAPVSGASMNTFRSIAPELVLHHPSDWWIYVVGPMGGAAIAVGIAFILRGPGGDPTAKRAAQGEPSNQDQPS